ncbi:MAG: hypothetical protein QXP38_11575 [Nitrososphaerota archaeon]
MKLAEILDAVSKILAVVATALYQAGYIDISQFVLSISAIIALMAALLIHKHAKDIGRCLKKLLRPPVIIVKTLRGELIVDRGCKVCRHQNRAEIEKMLIEGRPYKEIVDAFNNEFSIASLSRHLRLHMPRLILEPEKINKLYEEHRIKQVDLTEELFRLLGRLNELYQKLEKIDEKYWAEKTRISTHAYVESITERRNILMQIRETLLTMEELKTEIKTEKDLSELLQKLHSS